MNKVGVIFSTIVILASLNFADDVKIDVKPFHYGAFTYLGVIDAKGDTTSSYGTTGEPIRNQPLSRYGGYVAMSATVAERTDISVVLAMMTFNSLPLTNGSPFTRMQSLGSNLGQAVISYKFGDLQAPYADFKFGAFPYSYSSSKNLGGYLFTGGTYPGSLVGNYWTLIDGNNYNAQGMMGHFSFLNDALNLDVTGFFEHGLEPHYDLSPGLVASYKMADMIEIGAGAVFSHLIAWEEKSVTPKVRENAYIGSNNAGHRLAVSEWTKPGFELTDTLIVAVGDPRDGKKGDASKRPELVAKGVPVQYVTLEENGTPNSQLKYYTFQGTKVMGRLAITPFSLGQNLKKASLYSEVTLLGVTNYPFFYEKESERMPITFGVNLPLQAGFEVTAEAEHYKNKFMQNVRTEYENVMPHWREGEGSFFVDSLDASGFQIPDGNGGFLPGSKPKTSHQNGDFFWSVTAKKTFNEKITFSAKAAHDFLRLYNFFGNPSDKPAFQHDYGWYIALKSEINI